MAGFLRRLTYWLLGIQLAFLDFGHRHFKQRTRVYPHEVFLDGLLELFSTIYQLFLHDVALVGAKHEDMRLIAK